MSTKVFMVEMFDYTINIKVNVKIVQEKQVISVFFNDMLYPVHIVVLPIIFTF